MWGGSLGGGEELVFFPLIPPFYMHQFYNLRNYLSAFEGFESPKFKADIGNHPSSLAKQTRLGGSETWDDLEAGAPGG